MPPRLKAVTSYLNDLWKFRYFWMSMVRVDLRNRYRRSFLGLGWSLLKPISMTAVMCVVFSTLFQANIWTYGPFVLVGMTFWGFITESVIGGCLTFHTAEGYIRQIKVPLAMFPLRVALGAGFHFAILLPLVVVLVSLVHAVPSMAALLALTASLIMLFVLGWSLAILSGLVTVAFPDMKHILELVLQVVFYLTPIIYPADVLRNQRVGDFLLSINPFAYLLELVRMPLIDGVVAPPIDYAVGLVFTLFCASLAMLSLARVERRLVFWL
ncbi:ABC transporter permease [bacterium]|nr:ABC transporter permease [bacterium]